jgi:hypothetical protein
MLKRESYILIVIIAVVLIVGFYFLGSDRDKAVSAPKPSEHDFKPEESVSQSSKAPENDDQKSGEATSVVVEAVADIPQRPLRTHPDEDSILSFFREKGEGRWRAQKSVDTGKVFRILGGEIEGLTRDIASVRDFLGELGPELGVPADQVTGKIEVDTTGKFTMYDAIQEVAGIPVFEGWIRILGNSQTNNGFMFNNNLWPVELENLELPPRMTMDEAEQIIKNKYSGRLMNIRNRTGPVIWSQSQPHQSAFVFDITVTDNDLKVVLGAQSRTVVLERSTRMH